MRIQPITHAPDSDLDPKIALVMKAIQAKLKEIKDQNGFTDAELGQLVGVSQETVSRWLRGKGLSTHARLFNIFNY